MPPLQKDYPHTTINGKNDGGDDSDVACGHDYGMMHSKS